MGRTGATLEASLALRDAQFYAFETGTPVCITFRTNPDVTRDKYNTIIAKDNPVDKKLNTYAGKIVRNVTDRKLEQAGIRELCDMIVFIPAKNFIDEGYSFDDIDMNKCDVEIDTKVWKIADKGMPDRIAGIPIYFTLGLRKN